MNEQWQQTEFWSHIKAPTAQTNNGSKLGLYLKRLLETKGYSLTNPVRIEQFAGMVDVEPLTIRKILNGKTLKPHRVTLHSIVKVLNLTEHQSKRLFQLAGYKPPEPFSP